MKPNESLNVHTLEQRPDLFEGLEKVHEGSLPNYVIEGDRHNAEFWDRVLREFPSLQFVLCDERENVAGQRAFPSAGLGRNRGRSSLRL